MRNTRKPLGEKTSQVPCRGEVGHDIIVCGLGTSVRKFKKQAMDYCTIGVNDIDRYLEPDHLVLLDGPRRFTEERRSYIANTKAKTVWSTPHWPQLSWHPDFRTLISRRLAKHQHMDLDNEQNIVFHNRTSPFAAIGLAYRLGAERIGILGMDLLPDHHMNKHKKDINDMLGVLAQKLRAKGVILVNLSSVALINTIPTAPLSFIRRKDQWPIRKW